MKTQTVTREQVVALAKKMPGEKLARWYEYGLFIQSRPLLTPAVNVSAETDVDLTEEIDAWEAASDEDWLKIEQMISETV